MAFDPGPLPAYLHDFEWAIVFLPTSPKNPFIKVPIAEDSCLAGQAAIGLDAAGGRMATYSGTIANNVFTTYKILLLAHDSFFRHMDILVEIANGFYKYCMTKVEPSMSLDTAFAICAALYPQETKRDMAIHVLLSAEEVKHITKDKREARDIPPIVINPSTPPERDVVK